MLTRSRMDPDMPKPLPRELQESLAARNAEDRAALLRTWDLLDDKEVEGVPDANAAWADVKARVALEGSGRAPDRRPAPSRGILRRLVRISAAGAARVLLAALWAWMRPVSEAAPQGKSVEIRLPDGSLAQLNGGSEIRYDRGFGAWPFDGRRSVELEGEAYFDVVHGERPFVVTTSDAEIEVLGTRFNIRSWDGDTEVAVESGRVRVRARADASREVVLANAGDAVRIENDSLLIRSPAVLDYVLAWRRRAFAAIDRPLGTILQDVERLYGLVVEVDSGVALQDSMTLLYGPDTPPENILHDICLARDCRYRRTSRGFALFSPQ